MRALLRSVGKSFEPALKNSDVLQLFGDDMLQHVLGSGIFDLAKMEAVGGNGFLLAFDVFHQQIAQVSAVIEAVGTPVVFGAAFNAAEFGVAAKAGDEFAQQFQVAHFGDGDMHKVLGEVGVILFQNEML